MRALFFVLFLCFAAGTTHGQTLVQGTVTDARTGAPLPRAHVAVQATAQGTVTNDEGRFALRLAALPATLVVRYIGYETQAVVVSLNGPRAVKVALTPAVLELDEVFVTGSDFAENLMRKVLARKQAARKELRTYASEGYTRLTLSRQEEIVLLSEAVYDVYWDRQRGPREVVRARRQTADFYETLPVAAAGYVPDFYADEISLHGLSFIGPTHPDALQHYTFTLAGRRKQDDRIVYDLFFAPKNHLQATFVGTLSVLDDAYALLRAEVRPARHVVFPAPVEAWELRYAQQFGEITGGFWLPLDLQAEGTFRIRVDDGRFRTIGLRQLVRLTGYQTNVPLPEAPYVQAARVLIDSAAVRADPLFLGGRDLVPLTPREAEALDRLQRNTMTLHQAFPPERHGGWFAALLHPYAGEGGPRFQWPVVMGYQFRFRYNRVDGFLSSVGQRMTFSPRLEVDWRLAQATGFSRLRYYLSARRQWGQQGVATVTYRLDTDVRQQQSHYPVALASLPLLVGGEDYFDYFWNRHLGVTVGHRFAAWRAEVGLFHERHRSLEQEVETAWPWGAPLRPNPPIDEGSLRAATGRLVWGEGHEGPSGQVVQRAALYVEHSLPALGSDFRFTRLATDARLALPTLARSRPRPARLHLYGTAGTGFGTLPSQRFSILDASLGPYSAFGIFRARQGRPYEGTRHAGLFWQQDFQTLPFEALRLGFLVRRGTGLALYGAHGRTWLPADRQAVLSSQPVYQDGFHHEVGLSLTDVWGTPLHLDLTYRLDAPGFSFGFGF